MNELDDVDLIVAVGVTGPEENFDGGWLKFYAHFFYPHRKLIQIKSIVLIRVHHFENLEKVYFVFLHKFCEFLFRFFHF